MHEIPKNAPTPEQPQDDGSLSERYSRASAEKKLEYLNEIADFSRKAVDRETKTTVSPEQMEEDEQAVAERKQRYESRPDRKKANSIEKANEFITMAVCNTMNIFPESHTVQSSEYDDYFHRTDLIIDAKTKDGRFATLTIDTTCADGPEAFKYKMFRGYVPKGTEQPQDAALACMQSIRYYSGENPKAIRRGHDLTHRLPHFVIPISNYRVEELAKAIHFDENGNISVDEQLGQDLKAKVLMLIFQQSKLAQRVNSELRKRSGETDNGSIRKIAIDQHRTIQTLAGGELVRMFGSSADVMTHIEELEKGDQAFHEAQQALRELLELSLEDFEQEVKTYSDRDEAYRKRDERREEERQQILYSFLQSPTEIEVQEPETQQPEEVPAQHPEGIAAPEPEQVEQAATEAAIEAHQPEEPEAKVAPTSEKPHKIGKRFRRLMGLIAPEEEITSPLELPIADETTGSSASREHDLQRAKRILRRQENAKHNKK